MTLAVTRDLLACILRRNVMNQLIRFQLSYGVARVHLRTLICVLFTCKTEDIDLLLPRFLPLNA